MIGKIDGVMNGISVVGDRVGETLYYGPGAGGDATASAVVANIIDIVRSGKRSPMLGFNHPLEEGLTLKDPGNIRSKYYLRLRISDKPGMLAQITQLFADHTISVETMLQRPYEAQCAHLLFSTHEALESDVCAMIKDLESLDAVLEKPFMIRMV
jgi:homoserine dehydrogenase